MSAEVASPHCLLVPYPEYGHISPMLTLASHLASCGCTVTFLAVQKPTLAGQEMRSDLDSAPANALPSNLRFRRLTYVGAPSLLTDRSPRFLVLKEILASLEDRQQVVETMVQESAESEAPVSCIIGDFLLASWIVPLAKRQRILCAILIPASVTAVYLGYLSMKGKTDQAEKLRSSIGLPARDDSSPITSEEQKRTWEEVMHVVHTGLTSMEKASFILANSCEGLETEVLEMARESELNVRLITPCFPAENGTKTPERNAEGNAMAKMAGSPFTENESCMPWLDKQPENSVLLVSFGSEGILDADQLQEMAIGIEASGYKFLWVSRVETQMPPKDMLERTRDVGMCVPWLPQRKVLNHSAVGGFLTHCGWNSTLEGICFGVPMLCFPLIADQFLNANLIHTHWKVGLCLGHPHRVHLRTLVQRAEMERCVQELMGSEKLRRTIAPLQSLVQDAWLGCKSSISSFVQEICSCSVLE